MTLTPESTPDSPADADRSEQARFGRRSLLRGSLALGGAAAIGQWQFGRPLTADAVATPSVVGTSTWGAAPPVQAAEILPTPPRYILVHHTAGHNTADYSAGHVYSIARGIQQSHFNRGFIDTGQQFTIGRGGHILEGRHRSWEILRGGTRHLVGQHVGGNNAVAIGIENVGTYIDEAPTYVHYASLVQLVAYMCQQYDLATSAIVGHRDLNATACPGAVLYKMLPQFRRDVATVLAGGRPGRPPAGVSWGALATGARAERVRTVQYLLRHAGHSLTIDGDFGSGTDAAVRAYQSSEGLVADGIVGPITWENLRPTVRSGANGYHARAVQSQLNTKGERLVVDGAFGSLSVAALKRFQTGVGIASDGVCGPTTWLKLAGRPPV
jgi:hypothetical protein